MSKYDVLRMFMQSKHLALNTLPLLHFLIFLSLGPNYAAVLSIIIAKICIHQYDTSEDVTLCTVVMVFQTNVIAGKP